MDDDDDDDAFTGKWLVDKDQNSSRYFCTKKTAI